MRESFKLTGVLIDTINQDVGTVDVVYHQKNGYEDFEELIQSEWIRDCRRTIPFLGDVRIVYDDVAFSKKLLPSYIIHDDDEIKSIIVGNIFICKEVILGYGDYEFESLSELEIQIIYDHIVEINVEGRTLRALCVDQKDLL